MTFYGSIVKRILDIVISGGVLLVSAPMLMLVSYLIVAEDKGPVFYKQRRLGRRGKVFEIIKFRSMTNRVDRVPGEAGELIQDNPEITVIGRMIRRFKIDELPQLINVFKGDMSLIGPRPCLTELQRKFDDGGRKRLEVRPGCSGLAQVNGNIHMSWPERWKYDAYYVNHLSFELDAKILLKTFKSIFYGEERFYMPFEEFSTKHIH